MQRNTRNVFRNPFLAWTDLAWKLGEMSMDSAHVITHRTARMAAAGPRPDARDRQEFIRMGQEKIEAATESARAITAHLAMMNLQFGARALGHIVAGTTALMSLAASRSVGQFLTRQVRLAETLSRSAKTVSELYDSTARLATRGLKPIRARASANARRLGKR